MFTFLSLFNRRKLAEMLVKLRKGPKQNIKGWKSLSLITSLITLNTPKKVYSLPRRDYQIFNYKSIISPTDKKLFSRKEKKSGKNINLWRGLNFEIRGIDKVKKTNFFPPQKNWPSKQKQQILTTTMSIVSQAIAEITHFRKCIEFPQLPRHLQKF